MTPKKTAGLPRLAAAFCALATAGACGQQEDESAVAIQTVAAEVRDMRITAEATGEIEPIRKVEVKSKASGEILELYVDSGDEVEPGSLLARVDPRDVRNAHDQAKADLEVAEARMQISEAQLDRSEELFRSEVITAQEYETRQLDHANAQAQLVRATTNLQLAELRLADVRISAPMSGTILDKLVEDGQVIQSATGNVSGGTTLFVMANLDDMRVRTLVDETDVGQLSAGMTATVSVEAFPDRTFQGQIEKIEPQATVVQNVTMFPVIVLLDNRAGLLKPGMNAEVEVLVDRRTSVVTVPNNAVVKPHEVAPAAEVLGLDPNQMTVERSVWGELAQQAAARTGGEAGGAFGGRMAGAGAGGRPEWAALREQVASGEISRDSVAALMAAARGRAGGQAGRDAGAAPAEAGGEAGEGRGDRAAGVGGGQAAGVGGGRGGRQAGGAGFGGFGGWAGFAAFAPRGGAAGDPAFDPAVAFVVDEAGVVTARPVMLGLTDWDNAEVVVGLEEGEQVALIGAAQLQAQQAERMARIRNRMGGGRPFGG